MIYAGEECIRASSWPWFIFAGGP